MKKASFWFIISILISSFIWANQTIVELKKKLQTVSGKEKVEVLNKLAFDYQYISVEKALKYGKQALNLSKSLNDLKGEAIALKILGIGYAKSGNFEYALKNSEKSLKVFEKLGDKRGMFKSLGNIGNIYLICGNYDKAIEYNLKSLKLIEGVGKKSDIAVFLGNIGAAYSKLGNYNKALEYQFKTLEIREEIGDKTGIAASYNNIGNIYGKINDNHKALEYYQKSLKIKEELGDNFMIASTLTNIGVIYTDLKDYEKALEYLMKSLKIKEKTGYKKGIPSTLVNIGNIYIALENYDMALEYFLKAMKILEEIEVPENISGVLISLGYVYLKLNDFNKVLPSLNKGLTIAKKINAKELVRDSYFNFSEVYAAKSNYQKAFEYFKMFTQTKDEILNEKISQQIAEMQTKYDMLKKEKEIETLKKDNQIQQLILNRQKLIKNVAIFVSILLIIIFFQFFRRYCYLFTFWKKKNYIAHYKLVDKIGSGGMGDIYKARDLRGKSRTSSCAVKVLKEEYYKDDKYKTRFKNEAALIDQLNHPNIVKVVERGEHDGTLYIAMELLEGENLSDLLEKEEQISLNTALAMMMQMAGALAAIHKRGIIHRDLKPENIMVTRAGDNSPLIKILDFGLAKTQNLTRLTRTGMIMGTIFYVAPEQLTRSTILPAGDIYSLGVICYQILTGDKPFTGDTAFGIARQILKKEPVTIETFQPGVPAGLSDLVKKMMDKTPEKRPSANKVLDILKKIEDSIAE